LSAIRWSMRKTHSLLNSSQTASRRLRSISVIFCELGLCWQSLFLRANTSLQSASCHVHNNQLNVVLYGVKQHKKTTAIFYLFENLEQPSTMTRPLAFTGITVHTKSITSNDKNKIVCSRRLFKPRSPWKNDPYNSRLVLLGVLNDEFVFGLRGLVPTDLPWPHSL